MSIEQDDEMRIRTRVAHASEDDARFHGHSVMRGLAGRTRFVELTALAVSGRRLCHEDAAVLDDIATVLTTADPRIWPLKVVRLASSYGRVVPAIACGQVWQQSALIPFWECGEAAELLLELEASVHDTADAATFLRELERSLQRHERPVGFKVSFRSRDVRLATLRECLMKRGQRHSYRYWRLMDRVCEAAPQLGLLPNVGLGISAACLDLGFEPDEIAPLATTLTYNCLVSNAVEGARQQPRVLRELPDAAVQYVGKPPRKSPRSLAASRDTGSATPSANP